MQCLQTFLFFCHGFTYFNVFMAALWNMTGHIFLPCDFYLLLLCIFFYSSPNLSGRRLDIYHTSTRGVALVRIQNACLKCAARGSLKI